MKGAFLFLLFHVCVAFTHAQEIPDSTKAWLYNFYSLNKFNERFYRVGKSALFINQQENGFYEFTTLKGRLMRNTKYQNQRIKHGMYLRLNAVTNEMVTTGWFTNDKKTGIWIVHNPDSTITMETWKRAKLIETTLLKP